MRNWLLASALRLIRNQLDKSFEYQATVSVINERLEKIMVDITTLNSIVQNANETVTGQLILILQAQSNANTALVTSLNGLELSAANQAKLDTITSGLTTDAADMLKVAISLATAPSAPST